MNPNVRALLSLLSALSLTVACGPTLTLPTPDDVRRVDGSASSDVLANAADARSPPSTDSSTSPSTDSSIPVGDLLTPDLTEAQDASDVLDETEASTPDLPLGGCHGAGDCPGLDAWACASGRCECAPRSGRGTCGRRDEDCDGAPDPEAACGGACVDLATDPAHCGGCDRACPGGSTCASGACVCTPGLTLCAVGCVDLTTNRERCLYCARRCLAPGAAAADPCCVSACAATSHCGA